MCNISAQQKSFEPNFFSPFAISGKIVSENEIKINDAPLKVAYQKCFNLYLKITSVWFASV